jgi:MFS family permease
MSATFSSLRSFNYRIWAIGSFISNIGSWMQRVAQDWLVLTVLTDHSASAVGVMTGLQFGPTLLLSPLAGLLADRLPRRRLLLATQLALMLTALCLGCLVMRESVQLWQAYLLAFVLGSVTALEGPARQVFVSELVPEHDLANAVALNNASFNAARLIGPGIAGLLISWVGTGPAFIANGATFGAVIWSLGAMKKTAIAPRTRPLAGHQEKGQSSEVRKYLAARPDLMIILVIVAMVGTFGLNFQLTTAVMATAAFGKGPQGYGLLGSVMAVGAVSGSLLAARRGRPSLRLVVLAAAAFGLCASVAALMPTFGLFAIALIPVGMCTQTLLNAANATLQVGVEPRLRGRLISLYLAVLMGGTPFGSPLIGWIGQNLGPRWTILVGSLISLATAGSAAVFVLWRRRLAVRADGRRQRRGWPIPQPGITGPLLTVGR